MKKLLSILVLSLLFNSSLLAKEKFATLECKLIDDDINLVRNIDDQDSYFGSDFKFN